MSQRNMSTIICNFKLQDPGGNPQPKSATKGSGAIFTILAPHVSQSGLISWHNVLCFMQKHMFYYIACIKVTVWCKKVFILFIKNFCEE